MSKHTSSDLREGFLRKKIDNKPDLEEEWKKKSVEAEEKPEEPEKPEWVKEEEPEHEKQPKGYDDGFIAGYKKAIEHMMEFLKKEMG